MSGYHQLSYLLYNVLSLQAAFATSQRVFPTEYAYHGDSVTRSERTSANCMNYPPIHTGIAGVISENYIHCNGTQLQLSDSEVGPQSEYASSYYYEWSVGTVIRQLLFIFPTRVNLTTITLHYYSNFRRGLPPLRFYAVPDDHNIWDAAPTGTGHDVVVAEMPPTSPSAGGQNISVNFNFTTMKVLMVKAGSSFNFSLSEVEFSDSTDDPSTTATVSQASTIPHTTTHTQSEELDATMFATKRSVITSTSKQEDIEFIVTVPPSNSTGSRGTPVTVRESIAWTLAAVLAVLFLSSLTINITQWWIYKKRQTSVKTAAYEMEGNPCYEAAKVNQSGTADTNTQDVHVYDVVQGQRSN